MKSHIAESFYPITFRAQDARALGEQIKNRQSVVLIGMKRVGISNFLRFFLNNREIKTKYINDGRRRHFFIPVDLNDMIEREIYPFWVLTQKRILDAAEDNNLNKTIIQKIDRLFTSSIQAQDLFLTIDNTRKSLLLLTEEGVVPTIFYLRFDRMKEVATPEFFDNLQGVVTATSHNVSYVFTSARSLDVLAPDVFVKSQVAAFAHNIYIKPSEKKDAKTIYSTMNKNSKLKLDEKLTNELLHIVDGYTQYLFFALAFLNERKNNLPKPNELSSLLLADERISLQSEELWESLTDFEQQTLVKFQQGTKISKEKRKASEYLWNTGFINGDDDIFSILFSFFIQNKSRELGKNIERAELTRKENLFLNLLLSNKNEVCERESIISAVWPEAKITGVSDWAIDRLVARLRVKLKIQNASYEVLTIKTRGYKLSDI